MPVVAALGLGLATAIPGRSPLIDGFGLIAFASVFPIMSVLAYAMIAQARQTKKNELTDESASDPASDSASDPAKNKTELSKERKST